MKREKLFSILAALKVDNGLKMDEGSLFVFDTSQAVWVRKTKAETMSSLFQKLAPALHEELTSAEVNEVRKELAMRPEFAHNFRASALHDARIHAGKDMLRIDGETIDVTEARREDFSSEVLDFRYIKDAKLADAPVWMSFLQGSFGIDADLAKQGAVLNGEADKIMKDTSVRRLFEFIGYAVAPPGIWGTKKMLVLLGPPNTGKSQILELVRRVKGEKGIVSMSPHDLGDRFRSGMIQDATLILNDEIPTKSIPNLDILKKVIAGEPITSEKKGVDPVAFCPRIKLLFAGNLLPKTAEPDYRGAFADRLSVVVFPNPVEVAARNIHLADDFFKERDVIFSLAVQALSRLMMANYIFSKDSAGDIAVANFREDNASVELFLKPEMKEVKIGSKYSVATAYLYKAYEDFCGRNALDVCSKNEFRTRLIQEGFKGDIKVRVPGHKNPLCGFKGIGLYRDGEGE